MSEKDKFNVNKDEDVNDILHIDNVINVNDQTPWNHMTFLDDVGEIKSMSFACTNDQKATNNDISRTLTMRDSKPGVWCYAGISDVKLNREKSYLEQELLRLIDFEATNNGKFNKIQQMVIDNKEIIMKQFCADECDVEITNNDALDKIIKNIRGVKKQFDIDQNRFWPTHYVYGGDEKQYDIDLDNSRFYKWNDISVKHLAMGSSGYNGEIIQKKARNILKQFCKWMTITNHPYFSKVDWNYNKFEELWKTHKVDKYDEKNVELFMTPICDALNYVFDDDTNNLNVLTAFMN